MEILLEPTSNKLLVGLDDGVPASFQRSRIHKPHAHTQAFKGDVQALITKAVWEKKNIPRRIIPHVQVLGAMHRYKFADKIDSSVPRMVADAFEERMPELLSDTLKNILPRLLNDSIGEVNGLLRQCVKHQMQLINYIEQILHSSVKAPRDILVVNAKHLQNKMDRTLADLHELVELGEQQSSDASVGQMPSALVVHSAYAELPTKKVKVVIDYPIPAPTPLNTFKPITIDIIPYEQYTTNLFSLGSSKYSLIPPSKVADKGKGIA
ncbi:hypothetical protein Tco_1440398 [Tanacetum coccineum]